MVCMEWKLYDLYERSNFHFSWNTSMETHLLLQTTDYSYHSSFNISLVLSYKEEKKKWLNTYCISCFKYLMVTHMSLLLKVGFEKEETVCCTECTKYGTITWCIKPKYRTWIPSLARSERLTLLMTTMTLN